MSDFEPGERTPRQANRESAPDGGEPPVLGRHGGFDVYPMPLFVSLECADLAASLRWYREVAGFAVMFAMPPAADVPVMAHLRRGRYQDLMLLAGRPPSSPAEGLAIRVLVDPGEVDTIASRARQLGPIGRADVGEPMQQPGYNAYEVSARDPDGYRFVFHHQGGDEAVAARWSELFEARAGREMGT